jgi:hypothetical protein
MKTLIDLSNIDTAILVDELNSRGYVTDLLYSVDDVDMWLDDINANRYDADNVELSEDDKKYVLESVFKNMDYFMEKINEKIIDCIYDNYIDNK